jgi:uncharacterized protein HemX
MPEPSANSPSDQADASEQTAAAPERDAIDPGAPDQAVRDQTVAEPGAPDQAIPAQPGSGPAGGAIGVWLRGRGRRLAIAAGVVVVSVGIALWWQYRSFYAALSEQDRVLVEALEIARASQRELEQQLATLRAALEQRNAELNTRAAELADLRADLDPLPIELRALERSIDELQGVRVDARASWLREQAEYYLVLANAELRLGGRIATAIEALTQADGVLRTLGEPRLASVRAAIADELQALRVIDPPDVEGLALALGNLGDQADELPLRDQTPDSLELAAAVLRDL